MCSFPDLEPVCCFMSSSNRCFLTCIQVFQELGRILCYSHLFHAQFFETPWTAASQASLSFTVSLSLLKLMSIESLMPSNHLVLCRPLLLLPSNFPSIRVFSSESVLRIRWPKYRSFSFSTSPFNDYSGLISFRIDWLDLLAGQQRYTREINNTDHASSLSELQNKKHVFSSECSHCMQEWRSSGKQFSYQITAILTKENVDIAEAWPVFPESLDEGFEGRLEGVHHSCREEVALLGAETQSGEVRGTRIHPHRTSVSGNRDQGTKTGGWVRTSLCRATTDKSLRVF